MDKIGVPNEENALIVINLKHLLSIILDLGQKCVDEALRVNLELKKEIPVVLGSKKGRKVFDYFKLVS